MPGPSYSEPPPSQPNWLRDVLWVAVLGVMLGFPFLGQETVWHIHEVRHAVIPAEMAETGDFLVPKLLGEPYPDKPPTMHWVIALLYLAFGKVSMFLARTPSAAAGIAGALALYGMGRILCDRGTALWAALGLLGTWGWADQARKVRPDMFLAAFITLAALGFLAAMRGKRRAGRALFWILGGLVAGIATLTKGPFGILFPLFVVALAPIRRDDLKRPAATEWMLLLLAWLAVPLAWAIPVYLRDGGHYLRSVLFQPELMLEKDSSRPYYFYFGTAAQFLLPWTLLAPWVLKDMRRFSPAPWIAAAIFFVLLLIPEKKGNYLAPWYPFAVLACVETVRRRAESRRWRIAGRTLIVAGLVFVPLNFGLIQPRRAGGGVDDDRETAEQILALLPAESWIVGQGGRAEAIAFVAYEKQLSHQFTVREARRPEQLGDWIAKGVESGKPCFVYARERDLQASLEKIHGFQPERLWQKQRSKDREVLVRLRRV